MAILTLLERVQRGVATAIVVFCCSEFHAHAQDAGPGEMVYRTNFIKKKGGNEGGTAFAIDYKGKIYLVTARHVVDGVENSDVTLEMRRSNKWEDYHTLKTIYPSSPDVDIAVFSTNETATQPFGVGLAGTTSGIGVTFGQVVWFIGYPFGMSSIPAEGSTINLDFSNKRSAPGLRI
jgi:S1-C subfamily serine protease